MALFLTIALVHLIALMSPGPDFLFVSQTAVSRSRGQAMAGVVGITLGIAFWAGLALLGLQWLLHRVSWFERVLMVAGGLYLAVMGIRLLRAAFAAKHGLVAAKASLVERTGWQSLRAGLLTNLANPKAVVYFGSVFSALLGDHLDIGGRWGLWMLVTMESFAWFTLVAVIFALPPVRRGYLRMARWIDGLAGAVFIVFGLNLILARRS